MSVKVYGEQNYAHLEGSSYPISRSKIFTLKLIFKHINSMFKLEI